MGNWRDTKFLGQPGRSFGGLFVVISVVRFIFRVVIRRLSRDSNPSILLFFLVLLVSSRFVRVFSPQYFYIALLSKFFHYQTNAIFYFPLFLVI